MAKRTCIVAAAILWCGPVATAAFAQTERPLNLRSQRPKAQAIRPVPANPCAQFGAGFVRVEGSQSCVKIGGAISVGVGAAR